MGYKLNTQLSPNYTPGRGGNKIQYIVIHHWDDPAKNPKFEGAVSTLVNPKRGASAHYVVEAGRVTKLVDESNTAWHCGNFKRNQQSIGIECNPRCSEEDKKTIGELINDIQKRHGTLTIIGHKDVVPTGCPGRYYPPATVLKQYIRGGSGAAPTPSKPAQTTTPSGDIEKLARDVIAGKYGDGEARKRALGSKYSAVQARVNEILLGKKSSTQPKPQPTGRKSNKEIAKEVIQGKWGNGDQRRKLLTSAGYNYAAIQNLVNQMLK